MALPGFSYGQMVWQLERDIGLGRSIADLYSQSASNLWLVMDCVSGEWFNAFLKAVLLNYIFEHGFLFGALQYIHAVICMQASILEEIDVEGVGVRNQGLGTEFSVSRFKSG